MWIVILIGVIFLWFVLVEFVKDTRQKTKWRRDDRIMAAYQRQEAARMHARDLATIERIRQATSDEMVRVAGEVGGDVIEGTAVEVSRYE